MMKTICNKEHRSHSEHKQEGKIPQLLHGYKDFYISKFSLWIERINRVNLNWEFSGMGKVSIPHKEAQPRLESKFPNANS